PRESSPPSSTSAVRLCSASAASGPASGPRDLARSAPSDVLALSASAPSTRPKERRSRDWALASTSRQYRSGERVLRHRAPCLVAARFAPRQPAGAWPCDHAATGAEGSGSARRLYGRESDGVDDVLDRGAAGQVVHGAPQALEHGAY